MLRTLGSQPAASRLYLSHVIRVLWLRRCSALIHSRLSSKMKSATASRLPGTDVVIEVALRHALHPPPLLRYRQVQAPLELIIGLAQPAPAPFRDRLPQHPEFPGPGLPQIQRHRTK